MTKRIRRYKLWVLGDLHCGSTVGLCGPEPVELDDGGSHTPSAAQQWLYRNWIRFRDRALASKGDADACGLLLLGDLVDGDHHGTWQIISRDPAVQTWVLKRVMTPLLELSPHEVVVIRGTAAHTGQNGSAEEAFARWMAKEGVRVAKDPNTRMLSWYNYRAEILGHRLDAMHHSTMGQRGWTKGNVVLNNAADIFFEHAARGERHPDIALRGHCHRWFDTHDAHPTRLVQNAAWQLATGWAHQKVPGKLADIGGAILTFEAGRPIEIERVLFTPERAPLMRLA